MSDFENEIKIGFLDEAAQLLADTEQCFLGLESNPDKAGVLEKIFRLAHNLKGSAKAVGFEQLGEFTHELESYLLKLKDGKISVDEQAVSLLLACNDQISMTVEKLKENLDAVVDSSALISQLKAQSSSEQAVKMEDIAPEVLDEMLSDVTDQALKVVEIGLHSVATQATPAVKQKPADESIRVGLARLEKLLNFVGELVILQTVLKEQSYSSDPTLLRKTIHQMSKVTKEVQDLSMGLRMVPVKQTFQKMQRIVRDTSNALNKKVNIVLEGEDTEVDKTVLEKLADPLVHLIRNAVDHGIENGEDRIAKGKSEMGTVRLRAVHQSGSLLIEVKDDGAGLDPEKLIKKAIDRNILKPGATLPPQEAYQLIFQPGFSTKAEVTDVSGRGVGMDVVRTNIEELQGDVQIETNLGSGTTFKIRLPLTLAIIDGMIVKCGDERFIIPLSHVYESLRPDASDLHTVTGMGELLTLRGESLPLYRLNRLLSRKTKEQASSDGTAIVIRTLQQPFSIFVDDIIGQHQVVVKQLGEEHQGLKGFSGSAILGDGKPALIVELADLLKQYGGTGQGHQTSADRRMAA